MTLRVALNASPLLSPATGVGQYIRGLAAALQNVGGVECEFFYAHYWHGGLRSEPAPVVGAPEVKSLLKAMVPRSPEFARYLQQWFFYRGTRAGRFDIYHEPNYFPYRTALPIVTTIHDLSPLRFPDTHTEQSRRLWKKLLPVALRRSRVILTDSDFIRREIVETLKVPPERVWAVHLGVTATFRPLATHDLHARLAPLSLIPRQYILAVGTLEPRKNLAMTLDAYQALPASLLRAYPLVIVGLRGWLTKDLDFRLAPLAATGRVRVLGYVPEETLVALYCGAQMLVYPSLYEGFGLPPLEAMACGTPVVVSNRASLPEVVGDAGLQVEPDDVSALTDAMVRLIDDQGMWRRLTEAGLERSRRFTWERCALATLDAYRSACT